MTNTLRPDDLSLYHRNPRLGDVKVIADSLRTHGQYRPVVVNAGTHTGRKNEVLAGNHTVKAIRELASAYPEDERWQQVLVHVVDVDEDRAARIVVVDNRAAQVGSFDDDVLSDLLSGLDDLEGTGYTSDDLALLLNDLPDLSDFPEPVVADDSSSSGSGRGIECPECGHVFSLGLPKTPQEARD